MFKQTLIALGAVGMLGAAMPSVAFYAVVQDFLTEKETLLTYLKDAQSVINQNTMLIHQVTGLKYQLQNLQTLGNIHWSNPQQTINDLRTSINKIDSLNYTANDMDSQYHKFFPGADSKEDTSDYSKAHAKWVKTNQATMKGVLSQLHESDTQREAEATKIEQLKEQASHTTGALQAQQLNNELSAEQINQEQKLRATEMAGANAQAEYYSYQSQKDSAQQKIVDQVVQNNKTDYPQYKGNQKFGQMPTFGD